MNQTRPSNNPLNILLKALHLNRSFKIMFSDNILIVYRKTGKKRTFLDIRIHMQKSTAADRDILPIGQICTVVKVTVMVHTSVVSFSFIVKVQFKVL